MTRAPLIIYHRDCPDGVLAGWLLKEDIEATGIQPEMYGAQYGDKELPDVKDRDVYMVDFSYKKPVLVEMLKSCMSMTILDHHDSAEKELLALGEEGEHLNLALVFDMNKSGAGLVWDYIVENDNSPRWRGRPKPVLVSAVEDADLWRFHLPFTEELTASFRALRFAYGMDACEMALEAADDGWTRDILVATGRHILELREQIIQSYVDRAKVVGLTAPALIHGTTTFHVWAVECPYEYASDVGERLCLKPVPITTEARLGIAKVSFTGNETAPPAFSITYRRENDLWKLSLRSLYPKEPQATHVGDLARQFGGGGHPPAAGFESEKLPWE